MEKRLTRVEEGKMLCGVCAGIGKYFNIDPPWCAWALSS